MLWNHHTAEELRKNIRREIATISEEELQRIINDVFCRYMESIRSGGNIFSICCSPGEFLLHFLKIISTAIICLALFTDHYPSQDAKYDARMPQRATAVSQTGRKLISLYKNTRKLNIQQAKRN
jgi:hypothetical protein